MPADDLAKANREPLAALLRDARRRRGLTQPELGKRAQFAKALIGAVEQGARTPSLQMLAALAAALVDEGDRSEELARWLPLWIRARSCDMPNITDERRQSLVEAVHRLSASAGRTGGRSGRGGALSLANFPAQFQPLTIVCGDRRESPPKTRADMFIRSGAMTDQMFLPFLQGLDEPVPLCSDKLFLRMDEDWLIQRFSTTNLLILGSSRTNWASRIVAGATLFRPMIDSKWLAWDAKFRADHRLDDMSMLRVFWRIVETAKTTADGSIDAQAVRDQVLPDAEMQWLDAAEAMAREFLAGWTAGGIIQQFCLPGFADPADGTVHGQLMGETTDFAVVSLGPNPFDKTGQFVSILCAGISGPGTAHAVRMLVTEQERFAAHPYGGVIEVRMPAGESWPARFEKAVCYWETHDYTPERLLANVRHARDGKSGRNAAFPAGWKDADFVRTTDHILGWSRR